MRINHPITPHEMIVPENITIISETDMKGIITYVNNDFLGISGYSEAELIGKPHNIVRHPDMPEAGFADLWATLKRGQSWTGYVKNRAKNGDYYWVRAFASPKRENGVITGYLSVRTAASPSDIKTAEALYRQLREGKAKGIRLKRGRVEATGIRSIPHKLADLSINARILGKVAFNCAFLSLFVYFSIALAHATDQAARDFNLKSLLIAIAASVAVDITVNGILRHWLYSRLQLMTDVLRNISEGHYRNPIEIPSNNEIDQVMERIKEMQGLLDAAMTKAKRQADINDRIKFALDGSAAATLITDSDFNIIYMNKAQREMFRLAERDLRSVYPDFDPRTLLGGDIDQFHQNPGYQRDRLTHLTTPITSTITVGPRTFKIAMSPVINAGGERLGIATDWIDHSAELLIESEIDNIVQAAVVGDFHRRIALTGKTGFLKQLSEDINRLMQVSSEGLSDVAGLLEALARGDLTGKINKQYAGMFERLKEDANITIDRLEAIISQIRHATENIYAVSREIAMGNNDLSHRTEMQAANLEKTVASMQKLTRTVKQNAENARQANQLALGAADVATKGGSIVKQAVATMNDISTSSKKIADIIGIIDGLAFQTNILALNAAVEAARAGDLGRGFAVVAGEVRNLAQRSATAAHKIKALIDEAVKRVDSGAKLVNEAGLTMNEIVAAIQQVTDIMSEITTASQQFPV